MIRSEVEAVVAVTQVEAFRYIVPIDLLSIFTGYGLLPAVTRVSEQKGAWDGAGQDRTFHFSDGSSAHETLTAYEYPSYFSLAMRSTPLQASCAS